MLESNMSDEDVSKKLNEKLKEQQDKIWLLEEMVSSKWDQLDGIQKSEIPDVKWDTNNEEILWMLATFITSVQPGGGQM